MTQHDLHRQLLESLGAAGCSYRVLEHEPVTTSKDAARVRGVELSSGAKAMLVKTDSAFYLAVLAADRRIDWRGLRRVLRSKKVRLADEGEVAAITGLPKGAIPPVGELFSVPTVMDESLLDTELVRFNAGSVTKSVEMRREDLVRLNGDVLASFSAM